MKKRIIKKHVRELFRATCIYETRSGCGPQIVTAKRATKPLSGQHMRSLLYRFQTRRYVPEFEDVIFLDELPDNGRWKFNPRRQYVLTADDQGIGFLRRAADTPTRRQVEIWRREREKLESGEEIW